MATETEFGRKPRSKGTINPTKMQMTHRHVGRIGRLKSSIAKAKARGNNEKVASLQAELDRRLAEVADIKAELDNL